MTELIPGVGAGSLLHSQLQRLKGQHLRLLMVAGVRG